MPHHLTNFEIQKYHQNEAKFNGVYSRNNLPKLKDGAYTTNLEEFKSIGTHWIDLYVNANNIVYFDSFGDERIPKKNLKIIGSKNIITNIYEIQTYDLIMCGHFCIGFTNFKLKYGLARLFIQIYFLLMIMRRMIK